MSRRNKTEIIFSDLFKSYLEINNNRRKPRIFRLAFEVYVTKSQQLTETMRKEFSERTGSTWQASKFNGWNEFTGILKKIRNSIMHGCPPILNETMLCIYPNVDFYIDDIKENEKSKKKYRIMVQKCFISDMLSEKISSSGFSYLLKNSSKDKNFISNYVQPIKSYIFYEIDWHSLELEKFKRSNAGQRLDALTLTLKSFPVFEEYMKFYKNEFEKNINKCFKDDYFVRSPNGSTWVVKKNILNDFQN